MLNLILGTDEAGYGPNLGPLTIGASLWSVPTDMGISEFYERLQPTVAAKKLRGLKSDQFVVADSKEIYQSKKKLDLLERGVLSILSQPDEEIKSWQNFWELITSPFGSQIQTMKPALKTIPWLSDVELSLPVSESEENISLASSAFKQVCHSTHIQHEATKLDITFPEQFNQEISQNDSKGVLLTGHTIQLVSDCINRLADRQDIKKIYVYCDRHGGRTKYSEVLQNAFPDQLITIAGETKESSVYRWKSETGIHIEVRFSVKSEKYFPVAFASMVAKYARELCMEQFNHFWQQHIPEIKPTAGYPVDAKRFRKDLKDWPEKLNISWNQIWRNK